MTSISQDQAQQSTLTRTASKGLRGLLPKRWYAHVILIFSVIMMGFPLLYAMIVSTQGNAEVFAYQFTPGNQLERNWNIVMNQRNLGLYMVNSTLVSIVMTFAKAVFSLLAGLGRTGVECTRARSRGSRTRWRRPRLSRAGGGCCRSQTSSHRVSEGRA